MFAGYVEVETRNPDSTQHLSPSPVVLGDSGMTVTEDEGEERIITYRGDALVLPKCFENS